MTRHTTTFLCLLALMISVSLFARADVTGLVRERGSLIGIAGVSVTNGRDVVRTDSAGKYTLPSEGDFIYLTRSSSFVATRWYQRLADGVNFEVARQIPSQIAGQNDRGFFFIQISDAHVFDRLADFADTGQDAPWFMPDFAVDWLTVNILKRTYGDGVIDKLRDVLRPSFNDAELDDMWDISVYQAYATENARENSIFGDYRQQIKSAFAEVLGLNPEFVINTGDLVLESNRGSAEAIDRWFQYYVELTETEQTTFYNTIGNNEIAGNERPDFSPEDPRFGKFFFKNYLGPTHFSFDYGPFHFVALDTHRAEPTEDNPDFWNYGRMEPRVSEWARQDLGQHRDKTIVVLNHEPFHFDPIWPFEDDGSKASDESMFKEFGVSYVLSGHTHFRSYMQIDNIHHITTGALSGFRWVLPTSIHPRGYRLFYAKDGFLYSAWKLTGEQLIELAEPQPADKHMRIIAAADHLGPFARLAVSANGESIPTERWGDYFFRVHLPDASASQMELTVTDKNGLITKKSVALEFPD